jgi:hypothetical protein
LSNAICVTNGSATIVVVGSKFKNLSNGFYTSAVGSTARFVTSGCNRYNVTQGFTQSTNTALMAVKSLDFPVLLYTLTPTGGDYAMTGNLQTATYDGSLWQYPSSIPGAGTFSASSPGILFYDGSTGYKIGFDNVGSTRGFIRYNVDTADSIHGHVFSAGASGSQTDVFGIYGNGNVTRPKTVAGSTGNQTINNPTGIVSFAGAATSLIVTNSLVTTNSIISLTVQSNDTTMKSAAAVPATGSFTIYPSAAPTGTTAVSFSISN